MQALSRRVHGLTPRSFAQSRSEGAQHKNVEVEVYAALSDQNQQSQDIGAVRVVLQAVPVHSQGKRLEHAVDAR